MSQLSLTAPTVHTWAAVSVERIKAGLASHLPVVIDDQDAFLDACRFGIQPIIFHDFVVRLAKQHGMSRDTAIEIIHKTSRQFPRLFLAHTLEMLREE